jgi:hypothetical protein
METRRVLRIAGNSGTKCSGGKAGKLDGSVPISIFSSRALRFFLANFAVKKLFGSKLGHYQLDSEAIPAHRDLIPGGKRANPLASRNAVAVRPADQFSSFGQETSCPIAPAVIARP